MKDQNSRYSGEPEDYAGKERLPDPDVDHPTARNLVAIIILIATVALLLVAIVSLLA
jgi:hypothetical protein